MLLIRSIIQRKTKRVKSNLVKLSTGLWPLVDFLSLLQMVLLPNRCEVVQTYLLFPLVKNVIMNSLTDEFVLLRTNAIQRKRFQTDQVFFFNELQIP